MIDPIAVGMTREYTLKDDKENPTVWVIGSLDSIMASRIISKAGRIEVKDGNPTFVSGGDIAEYDFTIVRFGLKGWKNYLLNGTEAVFETRKERIGDQDVDVPTDKTLSMIPLFAIHELAMEIWGSNNVNEDLRKN